jgi:phosphoribosylanthranilate isomerase
MVRIKICGVTTADDARLAAEAGADAIGLNFYPPSPRSVLPSQAMAIIRVLPPFTAPVGVFVGQPLRQVCAIAYQLGLRAVQTYDSPPGEDTFPFAHIPAFRVRERADLDAIRRFVADATAANVRLSAILVDARVEGQYGGTGHKAPWPLLRGFDVGVPLILAGGLTPDNVDEAIATVRPWGVDVASGVERSAGVKDWELVRRFIAQARRAGS